jgi:hypothetical protein
VTKEQIDRFPESKLILQMSAINEQANPISNPSGSGQQQQRKDEQNKNYSQASFLF